MSPEKTPRAREPRITVAERRELLPQLAEDINTAKSGLVLNTNWPQVEPFATYIGLAGFLDRRDNTAQEKAHVRKIMAFERQALPVGSLSSAKAREFLEAIDAEIKEEIKIAGLFQGDIDKLKYPYKAALADWDKLRELVVDPIMFALKQSVKQVREKRK